MNARTKITLSVVASALAPLPLFAAGKSFQQLVDGPIIQVGNQLISLLYALAFIAFLINMVRFFFSDSPEQRQTGKVFALYSIIGFVVLFGVWALVNFGLGILTSLSS